jgi:diaminopimelate epimerase
MMTFHKYQGAGNDFLIADNRDGHITEKDGILTAVLEDGTVWSGAISDLCDRRYGVGADGLMLLDAGSRAAAPSPSGQETLPASADDTVDFHMTYFNSDGSGGMMCGNGGRCIVAFAYDCGVVGEAADDALVKYRFTAADGPHQAYILEVSSGAKIVRLGMKDVESADRYESLTGTSVPSTGFFLDTGTRHYVRIVDDVDAYDVVGEGRDIRYNAEELQPIGANVNYAEPSDDHIKVRTYEKGVEDETFACGTGIVASVLAAYVAGTAPVRVGVDGRLSCKVQAKKDRLSVDFMPSENGIATDVHLTGPAVKVCEISF